MLLAKVGEAQCLARPAVGLQRQKPRNARWLVSVPVLLWHHLVVKAKKLRGFYHAFCKFLLSPYYVLGTVVNAVNTARTSLPSWS